MHKQFWLIGLKWGSVAGFVSCAFDAVIRYVLLENQNTIKQILALLTVLTVIACVYVAIKEYRKKRFEDKSYTFSQAMGIATFTSVIYGLVFAAYFFVLSSCIDTQLVANYKQKQINAIEQSQKTATEKEKAIESVADVSLLSLLVGNFLQSMVFPLTAALFLTAFLQRKPNQINPNKNT